MGLCATVWDWDLLGWVCVPGRGIGTLLDGFVCQGVGLGPLRLQCPLRGPSALWMLLTHTSCLPFFSPWPRVALSAAGFQEADGKARAGEHQGFVAFVVFAQGRANTSVSSQAWKEHSVLQPVFVFGSLILGPCAQLARCLDLLQEDNPHACHKPFFVCLG